MFKTESDAREFVDKWSKWGDDIWTSKKPWDVNTFRPVFAEDVKLGYQGKWTDGLKQTIEVWGPAQKAFKSARTLGIDIESFGESVVRLSEYGLMVTWDNKEIFIVNNWVIDVDKNGKVCRQNGTAKAKYADQFDKNIAAYFEAQSK